MNARDGTINNDEHATRYAAPTYAGAGTFGNQSATGPRDLLRPLLDQLRKYDALRVRLGREGGRLNDLRTVTRLLSAKFCVSGRYRNHDVALIDRQSILAMLADAVDYSVQFDVRQIGGKWPAYYICRTKSDYWSEYSLIVEDLYISPGYPLFDDRFVKLMSYGHESYYLRLSCFREAAQQHEWSAGATSWQLDSDIYQLGRHIFQAAWHEDQRPAMLIAKYLQMPNLRHAIELLYLCLSGELCALRGALTDRMTQFFESVYPQPAILGFLSRLSLLDGQVINDLPRQAASLYARLGKSLAELLNTSIRWQDHGLDIAIHKIIFANLWRLDVVSDELLEDGGVKEAVDAVENRAAEVIQQLTADST